MSFTKKKLITNPYNIFSIFYNNKSTYSSHHSKLQQILRIWRKIQNKFHQILHTAGIDSVKLQENIHLIRNGSLFHFRIILFYFTSNFLTATSKNFLISRPFLSIITPSLLKPPPFLELFFHLGTCFFNLTSMEPFSAFRSFAVFVVHGHCCILQDVSSVESALVLGEKRPYIYTGGKSVRTLTGGSFFMEGYLRRAYAGKFAFAKCFAFANAFVFNHLEMRIPHLHGHIFPFIDTSFLSRAYLPPHLPLYWHIFPFICISSRSGRWGEAWAGHSLLPRNFCEAFAGIRKKTLNKKCPIKFMARLHTLSFSRFVYADYLREYYYKASAKCLCL